MKSAKKHSLFFEKVKNTGNAQLWPQDMKIGRQGALKAEKDPFAMAPGVRNVLTLAATMLRRLNKDF